MKYMGNKRTMLQNGLGHLLDDVAPSHRRFYDLFTGSSSVSTHVSTRHPIEVRAFDLQSYGVTLANAILLRDQPWPSGTLWRSWIQNASKIHSSISTPNFGRFSMASVKSARLWSSVSPLKITAAYGGHYYSPDQAVWIDCLLQALPKRNPQRTLAKAALIHAASHCAAAPGHTAQPFQPTATAIGYLEEAWHRDILLHTEKWFVKLSAQHAIVTGSATVGDAVSCVSSELEDGDLCFIDPPYSGVHYSRFYHVLESIATEHVGSVEGTGRYPKPEFRPKSQFSMKSTAPTAMGKLLEMITNAGASAIITFPDKECSNGLSGDLIRSIASENFYLREEKIQSSLSTLGGATEAARAPKLNMTELILILTPRRNRKLKI